MNAALKYPTTAKAVDYYADLYGKNLDGLVEALREQGVPISGVHIKSQIIKTHMDEIIRTRLAHDARYTRISGACAIRQLRAITVLLGNYAQIEEPNRRRQKLQVLNDQLLRVACRPVKLIGAESLKYERLLTGVAVMLDAIREL